MSTYRLVFSDGSLSGKVIDRDVLKGFAKNMEKLKPVDLIAVLIKSKIKCAGCKDYPVWDEGDLCPSCHNKKNEHEEEKS